MPPGRESLERLPPQSIEAERSVLGGLLRDKELIPTILAIVRVEHFYTDAHQKIFQVIVDFEGQGKAVDLITLAEELKQRGQIEDIGGYGYLGELWEAAPTAAHAEWHAQIVQERALVRSLIHASTEILRDAYEQAEPVKQMLDTAERKILEISEVGFTGDTKTLSDTVNDVFERINDRYTGDQLAISGMPTGYRDLDEIMAGLQKSELVIVAARPSVGKTSFALNLIRNITVDHGQPAFFVSLEQSRLELAERLLCCQAKVDSHRVRKGNMSAEDIGRLTEAASTLKLAKLFIDDNPSQSMMRIAANARRLKKSHGIQVVAIDYLQLIDPENRRDPRQEQVAQISRRLKFLARDLAMPVIALAQVNRQSEDRQDHRPRLADLRESGSIEQDADTVLLLHRPDRYEPGQHDGIIEVIVGKQRNGPTGEVTLAYLKQYMRYEDFAMGTPFES